MRFASKFKNHVLIVEPAIRGVSPGKKIEFKDGVYETEDKKEIKAIKSSRDFGLFILEDVQQAPSK